MQNTSDLYLLDMLRGDAQRLRMLRRTRGLTDDESTALANMEREINVIALRLEPRSPMKDVIERGEALLAEMQALLNKDE